jgi:hypothetical protein
MLIVLVFIIRDDLQSLYNHLLIRLSSSMTTTITTSLIYVDQNMIIFISSQTPGSQSRVFLVSGHVTHHLATRNPALHRRLVFQHNTLMTISHRDVRSPQEMTVARVLHNSVEYIILLSVVRDNAINSVITSLILLVIGQICDAQGHYVPPDTPPTLRDSDRGPHDWTPYNNRVEFELADFLFRQNQMSGGDINSLLKIWAATLAPHGDDPPFHNHTDLYDTIDSTPIGEVPWKSFTVKYDGAIQDGERSAWMDMEFEAWFRNPKQLVENMMANPDFNGEFDCSPFQEYDTNNNHRFCNFMSGDWVWKQAVCIPFTIAGTIH